MASTPIPLTVDGTGPEGAIPVEIHGGSGPATTASSVTVVPDSPLTSTNVQASLSELMEFISELAVRVKELENP